MGVFASDCAICRKPFMWQTSCPQVCSACLSGQPEMITIGAGSSLYMCITCGKTGSGPCGCQPNAGLPHTNKGWECPRCGRCYAPSVAECWSCNPTTGSPRPMEPAVTANSPVVVPGITAFQGG
jgi:DNA-directed RNA polymerase subunit RPC12/RpoP